MSLSSESHELVDLDRYTRVTNAGKSGAMSASSGSHNVVDLDQFMRPRSRPTPPNARQAPRRREGRPAARAPPTPPSPSSSSSESGSAAADHKQCSRDSGLSDGSHAREETRARSRSRRRRVAARQDPSLLAMQEFRAQCERALREQQHQIARVAELCSRLAERPRRAERRSDVSSSSRSDRASSQCKTYKMIMRKLDELNRVYPPRAQGSPRAAARPAPRATARPAPRPAARSAPRSSSRSVSVVDKTIGTDDIRMKTQHFTIGEVRMQPFRKNYVVAETVVQTDLTDLNAKNSERNQEFRACACARRVARLVGCYVRALVACLAAPAHDQ